MDSGLLQIVRILKLVNLFVVVTGEVNEHADCQGIVDSSVPSMEKSERSPQGAWSGWI